jgi:hypothetical protein
MTPCLVISAEISIGQKQTTKTLAFSKLFRIKAIASSLEQTPVYKLAGACLITS